jgi:hypothetical protein
VIGALGAFLRFLDLIGRMFTDTLWLFRERGRRQSLSAFE